jgi:hypothetical protein
VSASLLLSGRYLVIATSLKGRNDPFDAKPGVGQHLPVIAFEWTSLKPPFGD